MSSSVNSVPWAISVCCKQVRGFRRQGRQGREVKQIRGKCWWVREMRQACAGKGIEAGVAGKADKAGR